MKSKLIALIAASTVVIGVPTAIAVASPDTKNGTNDSSSRYENKHRQQRDRYLDKKRGIREGSKADRRQDARIGHESS
jgi:hypothetical protein